MISIVILNWNGWEDTIECIESLYKSVNVEFSVVIVDNGSTDDSIGKLSDHISKMEARFISLHEGEMLKGPLQHRDIILYKLNDNHGFAKGNNLGLQLMAEQSVDYYWILNNDTIVEENSLEILKTFMDNNELYLACTPQIRYYSPNNRIWNCGGELFFGFRKYYYKEADDVVFKDDSFDITFVTGCALFIRPDLLDNNKHLFTERFFFGEEDFDFSLRMKSENRKMACCTRSVIYHKVSASTKKHDELPKTFIHYLNRYINIKLHFRPFNFFVWKMINNTWIPLLLLKKGYTAKRVVAFMKKLNNESAKKDAVEYTYFMNALKGKVL